MATGVVVDFGAMDSASASLPPSDFVTVIATTTAVTDPVIRHAATVQPACRMFADCRYSGRASATVAGPSRKLMYCAPVK